MKPILLLCASVPMISALVAPQKKESPPEPPAVDNPVLFLVRDPSVQKELKLKDDLKKSLRRFLDDDVDATLWALRDAGPGEGGERRLELEAKAQGKLKTMLGPDRMKRLDELILQYQGLDALLLPDIAKKMKLSAEQTAKIQGIIDDTRLALAELDKKVASGDPKDATDKIVKLKTEGKEKLVETLTDDQKARWNELLGESFDFSPVKWPGPIKAPEIGAATAWINSEPLTLAKLRGRVVVLHFWTFG